MRSRPSLVLLLLALAGCGGPTVIATAGGTDACPTADAIRYAEWVAPERNTYGRPGQGAWAIRLGWRPDGERSPPIGVVDPSAIHNHGFETMPPAVWILRAGQPACLATVTGYAAELIEDGPRNTRVSALAEGCAPEAAERHADAWVSLQSVEPRACTLVAPELIGRTAAESPDGGYQLPDPRTEVPATLRGVFPPAACEPACHTLWDLRATTTGEPSIGEVVVTRITPGPDDACSWPAEDKHAIVAMVGDDQVVELTLPPGEQGEGDAMTLAGVLVDGGKPRVVLLTDIAEWAAYPLGEDHTLGAGRRARTHMHHEEDWVHRSLAPYCGP